jgi:formylglycine-generating enzyme required for sulfatase activity
MNEWGHILAERGDTRKGVGLTPDGLPDIDWVKIPGGKFLYRDENLEEIELPSFHIARYPATYIQFQAFVDAPDGIRDSRWFEGMAKSYPEPFKQNFKYANHPREKVNWYQAMAFCRWLSYRLTGNIPDIATPLTWTVRLPTEHEWEKAARGTDGRVYPWGRDYMSGYANCDETYKGVGPYYLRQTTAVGMYPQGVSLYGVLDMAGNVWEWCLTEFENENNEDISNNNIRVLRGGSWFNDPQFVRSANRSRVHPTFVSDSRGFRCIRFYE